VKIIVCTLYHLFCHTYLIIKLKCIKCFWKKCHRSILGTIFLVSICLLFLFESILPPILILSFTTIFDHHPLCLIVCGWLYGYCVRIFFSLKWLITFFNSFTMSYWRWMVIWMLCSDAVWEFFFSLKWLITFFTSVTIFLLITISQKNPINDQKYHQPNALGKKHEWDELLLSFFGFWSMRGASPFLLPLFLFQKNIFFIAEGNIEFFFIYVFIINKCFSFFF